VPPPDRPPGCPGVDAGGRADPPAPLLDGQTSRTRRFPYVPQVGQVTCDSRGERQRSHSTIGGTVAFHWERR